MSSPYKDNFTSFLSIQIPFISFSCLVAMLCCAQSFSHVWLFATLWTVAHQAPLSMGILQARIMEWVEMPSSRGSSQSKDQTQVSHTAGRFFLPSEPPGKPMKTGMGSLSLLQGIFPTQESNWGLLHCRWILYQLSYQGSPTATARTSNTMLNRSGESGHASLILGFSRKAYNFLPLSIMLLWVCHK